MSVSWFPGHSDPFNWPPGDIANIDQPTSPYHRHPSVTPIDPVEKIEGMYRLLDLIGESGSNGYGTSLLPDLIS